MLGAPWQRKRRSGRPKARLETRKKVKKRDLLREKQSKSKCYELSGHTSEESKRNNDDKSPRRFRRFLKDSSRFRYDESFTKEPRRIGEEKNGYSIVNNALDLEREYDEHLEALKFLLERESPFENAEERRNSRNALNTLDFRTINTVALPENITRNEAWNVFDFRENLQSSFCGVPESMLEMFPSGDPKERARLFRESVDRVIQENRKIEEAMMSLLGRDPILKKTKSCLSREGSPASRKEMKTVRFKVEDDDEDDDEKIRNEITDKDLIIQESCVDGIYFPKVEDLSGIAEDKAEAGSEENLGEINLNETGESRKEKMQSSIETDAESLMIKIKIEADEVANKEFYCEIIEGDEVLKKNERNSKIAKTSSIVTIFQSDESGDSRYRSGIMGSRDVMEINGIIELCECFYFI